ncbi:uncharacterized protein LOC122089140 [Macadamia integrifolia]|uniref:uncharacterized protein LOC122089140 n=1 Tax=Macadamia integrifolia TaxID=60698 RepID=UPI001C4EB4CF|nr:uncharacterized protein LOC122089140 [Macadamia integrifolia]
MADKTKTRGNLDFSAPLLSTKRAPLVDPHLSSEDSNANPPCGVVRDISKRVPFSWERAPGMPKDIVVDDLPPPPKLPPARWRRPPSKEAATHSSDADNGGGNSDDDLEDDDEDNDDIYFSDAMDKFLSESLLLGDDNMRKFDHLEIIEATGDRSPGYIIRRVLPATTNAVPSSNCSSSSSSSILPVTSSSSSSCWRNTNRRRVRCPKGLNDNQCAHRSIAESYSTPKACGLALFFPWRTKPMLCGVKSPTRQGSRESQTSAGCFN